jgi:hypothetical protein
MTGLWACYMCWLPARAQRAAEARSKKRCGGAKLRLSRTPAAAGTQRNHGFGCSLTCDKRCGLHVSRVQVWSGGGFRGLAHAPSAAASHARKIAHTRALACTHFKHLASSASMMTFSRVALVFLALVLTSAVPSSHASRLHLKPAPPHLKPGRGLLQSAATTGPLGGLFNPLSWTWFAALTNVRDGVHPACLGQLALSTPRPPLYACMHACCGMRAGNLFRRERCQLYAPGPTDCWDARWCADHMRCTHSPRPPL